MESLTNVTNLELKKVAVLINAYAMATLNDEQKKVYIKLIKEACLFDIKDEVVSFDPTN